MQIAPFFYLGQAGGEDVAKPLIGRLGLYEGFPAIQGTESDGKGDVESE